MMTETPDEPQEAASTNGEDETKPSSKLAVAACVLGLFSVLPLLLLAYPYFAPVLSDVALPLGCLAAMAAIVLGVVSLGRKQGSEGFAVVATIAGISVMFGLMSLASTAALVLLKNIERPCRYVSQEQCNLGRYGNDF